MITDILTYISSYAEIRAVTGLNQQELPDATLALKTYVHKLGLALNEISGEYDETTQTLQEIFDGDLTASDPMYGLIQLYAIYTVADEVLNTVGLRAYKAMADGKSTLTRFSPESTYRDTRKAVKESLSDVISDIYEELSIVAGDTNYLSVVTPDVDLVIGEG